ncbi:hypothetical protein N7520_006306 [Penicillium odoratum]|uniref:uncharacterized protein n=1 Tax=Penicillium odoratum TaxID=1167516 RepID=UPI002549BFEA|nr:uncharacterized protein N7520_006306 [Penicillium odoratum]KAJ5759150.1 hypothetical protein N7520_006306 [Penicillium odoratum]
MPPIRSVDLPSRSSENTPENATQTSPAPRRRQELDPFTRTRICTLKTIAGWSYKQIQNQYPDIPYRTIVSTVHREDKRVQNASSPRSGRPKKLDGDDKAKILEAVDKNPHIKYEEILAMVNHKVAKQSIWRLLRANGKQKASVTLPPLNLRRMKYSDTIDC